MPTAGTRPMTLSEFLLAEGLLTEEQIQIIWGKVDKTGVGFGAAAVSAGFLDEGQVAQAMAEVCHVPYLDLANYLIDPVIARLIPQHIARRHHLVAINRVINKLTVAMADPVNLIAIDDIQLMTGLQVKVVVAPDSEIMKALEASYSDGETETSPSQTFEESSAKEKYQDLSEYFLRKNLLNMEQIRVVQTTAARDHTGFGAAAVSAGFLDDRQVAEATGEYCQVPYLSLADYVVDPIIVRLIPEHISRRHRLIPLNRVVNKLTVAMADPVNIIAIDDIQLLTGLQVKAIVAPESEIMKALDTAFGEPD